MSWLAASLVLVACGPKVNDVRVDLPDADAAHIDLVTPELTIEAGEEKMFCLFKNNTEGDIVVSGLESNQGTFGHHLVLLTHTDTPRADGTLEDCTAADEMWRYRAFVYPDTPLPAGHGIRIPDGMQYVLQFHYVNASTEPLLIRDVARLELMDEADVTHWVATLTTNSLRFEVGAELPGNETFDCTTDKDLELLLVGGHMHEEGRAFEFFAGPDTANLESLYIVDPWRTEFRDAPPVTLFLENPRPIPQGTVLRTVCDWDNSRGHAVGFPEEMCSAFAYVRGTQDPINCQVE